MLVYAFEPVGFEGELVTVEVDLRRGIPSVDLVGLPDGAVKEARERIRAAIRNSGFEFPLERLLISLAPAGVKKGGASFDLAMALAVLAASGQVPDPGLPVLALGEVELSGRVRSVSGVLAAVAAGLRAGIPRFIVPRGNLREARALAGLSAFAIDGLYDFIRLAVALRGLDARAEEEPFEPSQDDVAPGGYAGPIPGPELDGMAVADMADLRGQRELRRAMEVSAAGGHHALLFGPPGAGKSMAARRLAGLLPDLSDDEAVTVTMLHSLAGVLPERSGLIRRPPFRSPHHGASAEGMVGGGRLRKPGEISLAHGGVLLLDEAAEFRADVLQSLREPLETGVVTIARADRSCAYPSRCTLVLACNPCPCGNLGRRGAVCLCSAEEIRRYWKRLGGPLLDRIDLRIPVKPASVSELTAGPGEPSSVIKERVRLARGLQRDRYSGLSFDKNGLIPASLVDRFCQLSAPVKRVFIEQAEHAGFSSRACHSTLRVARTISDLDGRGSIQESHIEEAISLRRYGDDDVFWIIP